MPSTLREALELWEGSARGPGGFGDEVVAHYANNARVELAAFDAAVTDWELRRGFERLVTMTMTCVNPATEEVVDRHRARPTTREETDAAIERAHAGVRDVARRRAGRPGPAAAPLRRPLSTRTSRSWRSSRCATPGHTIGNARWEAGNVRDVLDYYAGAPERLTGRQIPVAGGLDVTFHEPLGVVGVIVPWNFPMPIAGWGFAPALAAGNTVVLKPAELTPLTAIRLAELALEAGLPEDVFTVLPGKGSVVGRAVRDPPRGPQGLLHRLHRGRPAASCAAAPTR